MSITHDGDTPDRGRPRPAPVPGSGGWPDLPQPLPSPVIDSHCHLDTVYDPDRHGPGLGVDEALRFAAEVGVPRVVQVGYDLASSRWSVEVARARYEVVAAVALHPNEAPRLSRTDFEQAFDEIVELAQEPRVRAIGETGLDYFRTAPDGRERQQESFRRHIAAAKQLDKTLVIHDRDAHDDVVRVLHSEGAPDRVVFHCFSGDVDLATTCAANGWFMSFAGPVTFKANNYLREALRAAPAELVLVETDAPYLAPLPHRGKPNASYLIPTTLRVIADVRGVTLEQCCRDVTEATERAFGLW